MTIFFFRIIEFSIYGSLWILLFLFVNSFVRKRSGALWQYFVVVCIAVHLLIPVHVQWISVQVPFWQDINRELAGEYSAKDIVEKNTVRVDDRETKEFTASADDFSFLEEKKKTNENYSGQQEDIKAQKEQTEKESGIQISQSGKGEIKEGVKSGRNIIQKIPYTENFLLKIFSLIWILGMIISLGKIILSYLAFCRQAKRWSLPAGSFADHVLEEVKQQYGIRRKIKLWRSSRVSSPMLYGVVRPVILLPEEEYHKEEYRYILQHELCHYRHGDVWMKYIFAMCKCMYWFHPLVRWMCGYAQVQMEIICDRSVVKGIDLEGKKSYSMVILRHMTNNVSFQTVPLTTGFYGGKDYMKQRFQNIMDPKKKKAGFGALLVAAALVLVLGGVKWSAASEEKKNESVEGVMGLSQKNSSEGKKEISSRKILVIGTDIPEDEHRRSADAIMLADVDAENGKITVENVPRDLLVDFEKISSRFPAEESKVAKKLGKQKLKAGYMAYGYGLLVGAVESLYQVDIDSHLVINYASVPKVIDAAGGVEITLTKQEADYLNSTNYISKKKNRNVKPGKQLLNGDQATGYLRIRKAGNPVVKGEQSSETGIFARENRCNNVILSFAESVQKNKIDWEKIIRSMVKGKIDSEIDVDISVSDLARMAGKVVSGEWEVVISEERTSADYVVKFYPEIGSCLQLAE